MKLHGQDPNRYVSKDQVLKKILTTEPTPSLKYFLKSLGSCRVYVKTMWKGRKSTVLKNRSQRIKTCRCKTNPGVTSLSSSLPPDYLNVFYADVIYHYNISGFFIWHLFFIILKVFISLPLKLFFQEILIRFLQTRDRGREVM